MQIYEYNDHIFIDLKKSTKTNTIHTIHLVVLLGISQTTKWPRHHL